METKVILLPENALGSYLIVELPLSKNLDQFKSFLLQNDHIYELKHMNGDNPHTIQTNTPQLSNNDGVKSWIFEDDNGLVVQSGNMLVSNVFNPSYLLISLFYKNAQAFSQRFITIEDLLDKLSSLYGEWINTIPVPLLERYLPTVCEIISQDDEQYYKYSLEKSNAFIQGKIDALVKYLENGDNSIAKLITAKLCDSSTSEIPPKILELAQLHYAVEFICNSYTLPSYKLQLVESSKWDFTEYTSYLQNLRESQKSRALIEENVNNIAIANSNSVKNKPATQKKQAKKPVKKVAVGKGALDGFFKKA